MFSGYYFRIYLPVLPRVPPVPFGTVGFDSSVRHPYEVGVGILWIHASVLYSSSDHFRVETPPRPEDDRCLFSRDLAAVSFNA
jgi:hypothetical protein